MACETKRFYSTSDATVENALKMAAAVAGTQSRNTERLDNPSDDFITETLTHLRSVLLSSKEGLTPKQILYDFIYLVGQRLPYEEMGYPDIVSLLDANSDICTRSVENGRVVYRPEINEKCSHIWRLVNSQRSPTRRSRPCKRKSISINEDDNVAPKRSKSETHADDVLTKEVAVFDEGGTILTPAIVYLKSADASPPNDKNKSVHFDDIRAAASQRPRRQRSRSRIPFLHKDDLSKPKFKAPRPRGRSTSSLPVTADGAKTTTLSKIPPGNAKGAFSRKSASGPSSNPKRLSRLGDPPKFTSTPRRSTLYPVPEDIRKNLLKVLRDFPKGVFVHGLAEMYKAMFGRELPVFLSSDQALTEFLTCLTADVRVTKHSCGSVTVKLRQFDDAPSCNVFAAETSSQSLKSRVVEALLRILRRRPRGIYHRRLRIEFFKETGEMIPFKLMGFCSEREMLASMPENFDLRASTNEPGIEAEYIVSAVDTSNVSPV